MKGRFQPSTVGNMIKCADGGYVCHEDYEILQAENAALKEQLNAARLASDGWMKECEQLAAAQKDADRLNYFISCFTSEMQLIEFARRLGCMDDEFLPSIKEAIDKAREAGK